MMRSVMRISGCEKFLARPACLAVGLRRKSMQACTSIPQVIVTVASEQGSGKSMQACTSIAQIIGTVNGEQWYGRWERIRKLITTSSMRQQLTPGLEDLTGSGVYSNESGNTQGTNYDTVNSWQVNYVRGLCTTEGHLTEVTSECYSDDALLKDFYSRRPGSVILDVGCNTGKNMTRAVEYGGLGTMAYGIEYSADSCAIARKVHGEDRAFQGDASSNFVAEHKWDEKFSVVQCTAVLQHLTPMQVQSALKNISRCLKPGGELLLTFKDAPTKQQLEDTGMGAWSEHVFTADIANKEEYLRDGYLRAVMWDDDYYPGVTSQHPPIERNISLPGLHRREFVFYSLEWMKAQARRHGMIVQTVEVQPDSKIPHSALHWMIVFLRE